MGIFSGSNSGAKRRRVGLDVLDEERLRTRSLFGQSHGLLLKSLEVQGRGFKQAQDATLDQARVSRSRALEQGAQAHSQAQMGLAGTGRGGTSLTSPTSGGLSQQIAQSLAQIDADASRLFGEFAIGAGQSEAAGYESLAALQERLALQESREYSTPKFNLLTGTRRRGD